MLALVDCNNFYVSCERVFNPKLERRPVVILSSNDGCIIARSNEAKALGIPMGAPFFQWRELIERCGVVVLSSNFSLYGDMSHRVMQILRQFAPGIEIYSVDEAFLDFEIPDPAGFARRLRKTVLKWAGIPVSIGIAPTKTLAKAANRMAKRGNGVFLLDEESSGRVLEAFPVEEVWGVGRRLSERLAKKGVKSAGALRDLPDSWARRHLSVTGLRTVWELRGIPCLSFDELPASKQSITCSKSFGRKVESCRELCEAVATYMARAAEKARGEGSAASSLHVFLERFPFRSEGASARIPLPEPTAYTPELVRLAKEAVRRLFVEGASYRKAGVILEGLVPEKSCQRDLFCPADPRRQRLMEAMDSLNSRHGPDTVRLAAEGREKRWQMRQERKSARFTTSWEELLTIHI